MTANQTTKAPKPGDPLRLDGFLYEVTGPEGLVAGVNRASEIPAFVAAHGRVPVRIDTETPDRWDVILGFARPTATDPDLQARRKQNHNYKRSGQCLLADLAWMEPEAYLEHLRAQGAQLVHGTTSPRIKRWRQAWVDANAKTVEDRIAAGRFAGAWVLAGRALLKPREDSAKELDRADIPEAVEAILTSTYDGAEA